MSPVDGPPRNSLRHLDLLVSSEGLALSIGKWMTVKQQSKLALLYGICVHVMV